MDEKFEQKLKYIGLRGLVTNWDHYVDVAEKGKFSSVRLLTYVVEQEFKIKQENARKRRISHAKTPEPYAIETFPFDRQPKLNRKRVLSIYCRQGAIKNCNGSSIISKMLGVYRWTP